MPIKKNFGTVKNAATKAGMHWSYGLIASMQDPASILQDDEKIVVIKDMFPKSRHHFLILPKKDIDDVTRLTKEDVNILKHMQAVANTFVKKYEPNEFKFGFHALPHLKRLHLHVISTDFDSPHLKKLHHWNVFNTPYFITLTDVIKSVEENGKVEVDKEKNKKYLTQKSQCHKCPYLPKDIHDLKSHLIQHYSTNNSEVEKLDEELKKLNLL